jgi:hypothetical protein
MKQNRESTTSRRDFVGKVATAAAALAGGVALTPMAFDQLAAQPSSPSAPDAPWDMSWVDQLQAATYRVVFDARTVDDRAANLAWDFFQQYHSVYTLPDSATRAVIVMRQLGTPMGMNDAMWDRYQIGAATHTNDHVTGKPATRNTFWRAWDGAPDYEAGMSLERLHQRGTTFLLCNRATMNAAADMAQRTGRDADAVRQEVRENLIPGAILMPDGIFALIRAQNAGAAYMGGV